jgi:hypothetical protein
MDDSSVSGDDSPGTDTGKRKKKKKKGKSRMLVGTDESDSPDSDTDTDTEMKTKTKRKTKTKPTTKGKVKLTTASDTRTIKLPFKLSVDAPVDPAPLKKVRSVWGNGLMTNANVSQGDITGFPGTIHKKRCPVARLSPKAYSLALRLKTASTGRSYTLVSPPTPTGAWLANHSSKPGDEACMSLGRQPLDQCFDVNGHLIRYPLQLRFLFATPSHVRARFDYFPNIKDPEKKEEQLDMMIEDQKDAARIKDLKTAKCTCAGNTIKLTLHDVEVDDVDVVDSHSHDRKTVFAVRGDFQTQVSERSVVCPISDVNLRQGTYFFSLFVVIPLQLN